MDFYTTTSFRESVAELTKKSKNGYMTVVKDVCDALKDMPDNILRDTNDRVYQYPEYRVVKLRIPNSGQKLARANAFRLIYWVSMLHDCVILMRVYPKRGAKAIEELKDTEYTRLQMEAFNESQMRMLHQVDVNNLLADLSVTASVKKDAD